MPPCRKKRKGVAVSARNKKRSGHVKFNKKKLCASVLPGGKKRIQKRKNSAVRDRSLPVVHEKKSSAKLYGSWFVGA